jgi:hypothetical protein
VNNDVASTPGQFSRASSAAIAGRRFVHGKRDKDGEHKRHLTALNNSFSGWVEEQMRKNPVAPWTAAIHDYLQYVRRLDSKYGSARGAVLTFGSGDMYVLILYAPLAYVLSLAHVFHSLIHSTR